MAEQSNFYLPKTFEVDLQFGLYCIPLLNDILRVAMAVNTFTVKNSDIILTKEDIKSTRIDIAKWVIGMIPAAIIGIFCPITGVITAIVGLTALFATLAEQFSLINYKSLEGRVTPT